MINSKGKIDERLSKPAKFYGFVQYVYQILSDFYKTGGTKFDL